MDNHPAGSTGNVGDLDGIHEGYEGPRWGVTRERTIVRACCVFEAEYTCDNCGHTQRLLTELHKDEFAWLCEGTLEHENDCPGCGDTMKLALPQNPILTLRTAN